MIMDYNAQFSDAQTLVSTSLTIYSTILDFEAADPNSGSGTPVWVVCKLATALNSGNLTVALQDSALSATVFVALATRVFSIADTDAVGDELLTIPLPMEHKRYLRMTYVVSASVATGSVDAYLAANPPRT
jgi:hypothetical protein